MDAPFGYGTYRMDLCLNYGKITLEIELKAWRDNIILQFSAIHLAELYT
ncbi:hypothetical protein [Brunnivagina elsteri]|nr:hypothetical protein [Calothrix elsteri]